MRGTAPGPAHPFAGDRRFRPHKGATAFQRGASATHRSIGGQAAILTRPKCGSGNSDRTSEREHKASRIAGAESRLDASPRCVTSSVEEHESHHQPLFPPLPLLAQFASIAPVVPLVMSDIQPDFLHISAQGVVLVVQSACMATLQSLLLFIGLPIDAMSTWTAAKMVR